MAITAPRHLSTARRRLYRTLAADYELVREPHALEVLRLACEALDRADQARRTIAAEGATYVDRFNAPRAHPAVAIERDARLAAVRCFRELSLDGSPPSPDDVRPPRLP